LAGLNYNAFTVINNKAYFSASDGIHGGELWVYDGTNLPAMIADIRHGPMGSNPSDLLGYNNKLYFTADDSVSGRELWVYDGINPPEMIFDIFQGPGSSYPMYLAGFKGKVCFGADDGIHGRELWCYDGINTGMITDVLNGAVGLNPHGIVEFGNMLYFCIDTTLYRYDGTDTPQPIYDVPFGSWQYSPENSPVFNGILYFGGYDPKNGMALWSFNGTDPPARVSSINAGYFSSGPENLTLFDNKLLFSANDGIVGNELFAWDGINPPVLIDDMRGCSNGSDPSITDIINDKLYIITYAGMKRELWIYDGYNAPAKMPDACSGSYCFGPFYYFITFKNKLYFRANYGETYGNELWAYDGINTPELVWDIASGPAHSNPADFIIFKNRLYFTAESADKNRELWTCDGISPPSMLIDINPDPQGPGPSSFFIFNDRLYFMADDGVHGQELWVYDGSGMPLLFADISIGEGDGLPWFSPVLLNGKMYFCANDGTHGMEPFVFDGINPPSLVYDINTGPEGSNAGFFKAVYGEKIFISANDGVHGTELWKYDGVNPPEMMADMNPGTYRDEPNGSNPHFMEIFQDKLYFTALQGIYNSDIWEYDGTNLKCITSDIGFGCETHFSGAVIYYNKLYFSVSDLEHCRFGELLWSYDGTNPPSIEANLEGKVGSIPSGLTLFKNKFYFSMEDTCEGREMFILCATDSTVTTTACKKYDFNGRLLTASGVYYDTIPNSAGCDSMITLKLTLIEADTTISISDNLLTSSATNAQYQWIDCENNYTLLQGQTNRSYEATASGSYAVIISQDNCPDTSRCISVHITEIPENEKDQGVSIYPNPVKEELMIDLHQNIKSGIVEITDIHGVLVLRDQGKINQSLKIDVSGLQPGVYIVRVVSENGVSSVRMIK
jgi:ELWxxDGT repeat protein